MVFPCEIESVFVPFRIKNMHQNGSVKKLKVLLNLNVVKNYFHRNKYNDMINGKIMPFIYFSEI